MSQPHTQQPGSHPGMRPEATPPKSDLEAARSEYVKSAAKEAGKKTIDYASNDPSQTYDNAKAKAEQDYQDAQAKAQGMWAKYCGCFASLT
ncbi:hypothetical protein JAAARDRAFT_39469 [Jaapia argillacea MUCL 33604]|uniref:Uncharacterized protein n=1 Tax=Jaapia argillacea MUCL 33604 TaxID=933084 RepID=A0A067PEY6_9AGAM|nr:hypothetical protein JAAARDRAFT_39469 [Jaapia argillacea MUCL 33604]